MLPLDGAEQYLANAYGVANQSRDRSNQNGAVIVSPDGELLTTGMNNFPPGVKHTEERATTRPDKYRYFEHAERWAIYEAARTGKVCYGATMYCPWAACCDCARGIRCAGIADVVVHHERMQMTPTRWLDDVNEALSMLKESGIRIHYFEGPIPNVPPIIVNGDLWEPASPVVLEGGNWFVGMDGSESCTNS